MNKFDRRRKYWLILDCETATLPEASKYDADPLMKQRVAIAKPLIYDLGWTVVDAQGRIYARQNFLIAETFSNPVVFNTAYYKDKRPGYIEKIAMGELRVVLWEEAIGELLNDMAQCEGVGAYNAIFDFKKAIPFTDLYISKVYAPDFAEWMEFQNKCADDIAHNKSKPSEKEFEPDVFRFRGQTFPLFDVWGLSCQHVLNCDEYRDMCREKGWFTASGRYYKTSAETAYRFVVNDESFIEAHTALDDAIIESLLFAECMKRTKKKIEMGIIYFPFKMLGEVQGGAQGRSNPPPLPKGEYIETLEYWVDFSNYIRQCPPEKDSFQQGFCSANFCAFCLLTFEPLDDKPIERNFNQQTLSTIFGTKFWLLCQLDFS